MTLHIDGNWNFFFFCCCWCNLPLKKSTSVCVCIWGCLKSNYNLATDNNNNTKLSAISFSIYAIIDRSCDEFSSMTYRKKIEREEKGKIHSFSLPFEEVINRFVSTLISGSEHTKSVAEKKNQVEDEKLERQIIIYHDDSTLNGHVVIHFIDKKISFRVLLTFLMIIRVFAWHFRDFDIVRY